MHVLDKLSGCLQLLAPLNAVQPGDGKDPLVQIVPVHPIVLHPGIRNIFGVNLTLKYNTLKKLGQTYVGLSRYQIKLPNK